MAKKNQRDPNLRATTVAAVNQLLKGGLTKAAAFEKIGAETGRAKDAVQMLYYRAMRAATPKKADAKNVASVKPAASVKSATSVKPAVAAPPAAKPTRRRRSRKPAAAAPRAQSVAQTGDFPALLNGIAVAINNLLKHVEKTVEDNAKLREQAQRLHAITSLIRGR